MDDRAIATLKELRVECPPDYVMPSFDLMRGKVLYIPRDQVGLFIRVSAPKSREAAEYAETKPCGAD